ncbi:hypothetical protein E3N88_35020 [Mikania micrantha]|uniref:Uncharacterized protein n=1 Tax=Mikania micrantha TaxID=192012 RepID=A0A5N6LZT0_9ASTR|nr:hypothetical protein E3N88_35020 [Mikania micrantha]
MELRIVRNRETKENFKVWNFGLVAVRDYVVEDPSRRTSDELFSSNHYFEAIRSHRSYKGSYLQVLIVVLQSKLRQVRVTPLVSVYEDLATVRYQCEKGDQEGSWHMLKITPAIDWL